MRKSRPVLITFSVLAGLQILTTGAALGDLIGVKLAAFVVLAGAAVQAGMSYYVQGVVVPEQDVAAYQNSAGQVVAGPAAGATNGTPVVVEPGTLLEGHVGSVDPQLDFGQGDPGGRG
jgi:hypothetical protein